MLPTCAGNSLQEGRETAEPGLQEALRRAAEKEQKELGERIIEVQIKVISTLYDKSIAYTNIIVVAGYAAFFALWSLTRPYLSRSHALWAALFMLVSAATFVFFEVYKMILTTWSLSTRYTTFSDRVKGRPANEVLAELEKLDSEGRKKALRLLPIWKVCLFITVATALAAVGTLTYSFVRGLISGGP